MLTCFIVDDEQSAVDILRQFVAKVPFLTLVGSTTNPLEALATLQQQPVDLVFLDIHMSHLSGLDLVPLLRGRSKVVLTTAHSEFALRGFELEVLDYLLKPISFERFLRAAQKALGTSAEAPARAQPEPPADDYIFVKTDSKSRMQKVEFSSILYVEGMKNYVSIATDTENIITLLNIKDLESRLPAQQFMRVHKSYIVSLNKIRAIDGNHILFKDQNAYVPLGDTYRTAFFAALQEKVMNGRR